MAGRLEGDIYIGGHSKGGNLALYGASFADKAVQDRIITVFNHDGPGLSPEIQMMEGYTNLGDKVETTLPQASLFGLIFATDDYMVVKSDRMGIMQHDPFSWEISGSEFIYSVELKKSSNKLIFTLYDLMENLDRDDRETFIDTVFRVISAPGVESFTEWPMMAVKEIDTMAATLKNLDSQTEEQLKTVLIELAKSVGRNIFNLPEITLPDREGIIDFVTEKINNMTKKDNQ